MPKKPIQSSAFSIDGENVVIRDDQTYADNHPYVKARPELFIDLAAPAEIIEAPAKPKTSRETSRPEKDVEYEE